MLGHFNEKEMTLEWETEDDDGEIVMVVFPAVFEVCDICEGRGTHVRPGIDSHGLTAEDFAEDPWFAEDYWAGAFDVTCEDCGGRRVMLTLDRLMAEVKMPRELAQYDLAMEREERYQRIVEWERRMGC